MLPILKYYVNNQTERPAPDPQKDVERIAPSVKYFTQHSMNRA